MTTFGERGSTGRQDSLGTMVYTSLLLVPTATRSKFLEKAVTFLSGVSIGQRRLNEAIAGARRIPDKILGHQ